jgi:hypothetical protein
MLTDIVNTDLLKGHAGACSLSFHTGGVEGSWVWQPGCNLMPINWKNDSAYEAGLHITEITLEFECSSLVN